jgi:hypothetical protein
MKEREGRERGDIWSKDGREIDEREMEEERKNRENQIHNTVAFLR